MIEKYLQDLECRIDPQAEESLFGQWRAFADGRHGEEVFSPKRPRLAPPSIEWPHVLVNDALEDCEAMATWLRQVRNERPLSESSRETGGRAVCGPSARTVL